MSGVCEYDPEHTPLPVDLSDPALPKWFRKWLQNYRRRQELRPWLVGPLPPLSNMDRCGQLSLPTAFEAHSCDVDIQGPRCPQCWIQLERTGTTGGGFRCPLDPSHDVSDPVWGFSPHPPTRPPTVSLEALSADASPKEEKPEPRTDDLIRELGLPITLSAWLRDVDGQGFLSAYQAPTSSGEAATLGL